MQSRAARVLTKAVVAAGTAGAIATAYWLLNRILDGTQPKCLEDTAVYLDINDRDSDDEYDGYYSNQELDAADSFSLLPVVSESDDESDENALGYTADYFTPHYDVCVLSVSVQTLVDPLSDVPTVDSSECKLCRAATESCDTASDGIDLGEKLRALSFSETDSSSNGSAVSTAGELDERDEDEKPTRSRTEQWLYVRL